jgi:hypothetical protein
MQRARRWPRHETSCLRKNEDWCSCLPDRATGHTERRGRRPYPDGGDFDRYRPRIFKDPVLFARELSTTTVLSHRREPADRRMAAISISLLGLADVQCGPPEPRVHAGDELGEASRGVRAPAETEIEDFVALAMGVHQPFVGGNHGLIQSPSEDAGAPNQRRAKGSAMSKGSAPRISTRAATVG